MINEAFKLKDEGNAFFKAKDYKKAIGKYVRIKLYLKSLSSEIEGAENDPSLSMVSKMNQTVVSDEDKKAV